MRKILIIEDHEDALQRMERIVNIAFDSPQISAVSTLRAARVLLKQEFFDLVVIDLSLPDGSGEDFILEITRAIPNAYIVVSTIHDESTRLLAALENGAKGYLLKEQPEDFLIGEFRGINSGKPPMAPAVTRRLVEIIRERAGDFRNNAQSETADVHHSTGTSESAEKNPDLLVKRLTEREQEILSLLAKGFDRPKIAGALDISKHTVATHVSKIYSKLNIKSRTEAALIASDLGLL